MMFTRKCTYDAIPYGTTVPNKINDIVKLVFQENQEYLNGFSFILVGNEWKEVFWRLETVSLLVLNFF